ncbi:germin-like protein 9-3 [Artemisia annua]|uniref:Germin-like protein 9-3 n=1 Tax=Artemisia annua TaxID=35608 RepID=A0A2U1M0P7_ARTAN|nr:germin-like protein 9-3 [Artemisia annua]
MKKKQFLNQSQLTNFVDSSLLNILYLCIIFNLSNSNKVHEQRKRAMKSNLRNRTICVDEHIRASVSMISASVLVVVASDTEFNREIYGLYIQVAGSYGLPPTPARRAFFIIYQSVVPYIVKSQVLPLALGATTFSGLTSTCTRTSVNRKPVSTNSRSDLNQLLKKFMPPTQQSVSYDILESPSGSPNMFHINPRASELLFVTRGSLQVGFVERKNALYKSDTLDW